MGFGVRALAGWIAFVALFAASAARADLPEELRGQPVVGVEIAGVTAGFTPERELGIPLGARVSRRLLRSALARLMASGRWADAQIEAEAARGGVRLIAYLTPRNIVERIEILGNTVLDDDELLRVMGVSQGDEIDATSLVTMARTALEAYTERGYENADPQLILRDTNDPSRKVVIARMYEGEPTRIDRIRFALTARVNGEPAEPPRESGARPALLVDEGDPLDLRRLRDSRSAVETAMREHGYLEAEVGEPVVERIRGQAIVTFRGHAGPRYTLSIDGARPLDRSDVAGVLELGKDPVTRAAVLLGMEQRVEDLYQKHGFPYADATIERLPGARQGTATLLVRVEPGQNVQVVAITFPGAEHYDTDFLRDQIVSYLQEDLPGSSIFSPVDPETVTDLGFGGRSLGGRRRRRVAPRPLVVQPERVFYAPTYDEAIEHVQELYRAEGYLDAFVGPATMQSLEDGSRAVVVLPVEEGPRTMLYSVSLSGNESLGSRRVLEEAALTRGMAFSYLELERARFSVLDLYHEEGYLFARVEPSVQFSSDRTRATIHFEIVERYPVTVTDVQVRGANATSETLIRDRVSIDRGALYRPSLARDAQERLLELGIFSAVTVAPEDPTLPAERKRVIVTVTERPPQYLDLSGGISTGQGARGGFEYGYRNLFGVALGLSFSAQAAFQFFFTDQQLEDRFEALTIAERLEYRITLGFSLPHIPGLPDVRTALNAVVLRDNERDFGYDKRGLVLSFTYRASRRLNFTLSEDLENNDIQLFVDENLDEYLALNTDPRLERLLRVPEGESTLLATRLGASLDFRDSPFTPTSGVYTSAALEYARTLQSERTATNPDGFFSDFLKLTATGSGYVPIGEVVLAGQLRFGRVFHLDDSSKTYPNRAFFLGGVDSMRGYLQDALVPQDLADEIERDERLTVNDVVRGADTFVLFRGEVRFPIVGVLQGGFFTDIGNSWNDPTRLNPFQLRPTAGLGLRVSTPVGPLALDYGFILVRRAWLNEPFGSLHFSIGLF